MVEKDYDVVVVGAGPAGTSASLHLSRLGHSVLLVDKEDFPRDKACGDCLSHESCEFLRGSFGLNDELERAGLYPITAARMVSPRGLSHEAAFRPAVQMGVLRRSVLDKVLVKYALSHGVEFRKGRVVSLLNEGNKVRGVVLGTGEEVRSAVVIGADGANSTVARCLGHPSPPPNARAVAVRAYATGLKIRAHTAEYFLRKAVLPGYAWVFPVDDHTVNLGCGATVQTIRRYGLNLQQTLRRFLEDPEMQRRGSGKARITQLKGWPLNAGSLRGYRRSFHGALLIGDAGHFVRPLEGEGIYYSLLSGSKAAEVINNAMEAGDVGTGNLSRFDDWFRTDVRPRFAALHRELLFVLQRPRLVDMCISLSCRSAWVAKRFSVCGDYLP